MKTKHAIFGLITTILISTHIEASYFGIYAPKEFLLIASSLLLIVVSLYVCCAQMTLPKVNAADWLLLAFYIFCIVNTFIFRHRFANIEYLIFLTIQFLLYFAFRLSSYTPVNHSRLLLAVISPLLIEFLLSLCQFFGVIPSSNPFFSVTGSFNNPGILAGYTAMCLPIALHLFLTLSENNSQRILYVFSGASLFVAIIVLINTESRGAIVAAALSGAYVLSIHFSTTFNFSKFKHLKWVALSAVIPIIYGLTYYLHSLRPESSSGRLFIWKTALPIIAENPMLGVGPGNFSSAYAIAQGQYFSQHQASQHELAIVDSVLVPFNEILGLVTEEGVIGALILILFIFYSLKNLNKGRHTKFYIQCVQASIFSVFIFSLVSYPSKVIAIQTTLLLFFAVANGVDECQKRDIMTGKYLWLTTIALVAIGFFALTFSYFFRTMREYHKGLLYSHRKDYPKANSFYSQSLSSLKHSGDFLMSFASSLFLSGKYRQSLKILDEYDKISYSYESNLLRAKNYFAISNYSNAILYLKKASQIVPSRFEPLHLLLIAYEKTGQYHKALQVSNRILNMPIKKPSEQIRKIREKANNITIDRTKERRYE